MMNKMFEFFMDHNPCPIWIRDLDLNYTYVNQAYKNLYQEDHQSFIGKSIEEVVGAHNIEFIKTSCLAVIQGEKMQVFEGFINNLHHECYVFPLLNSENEMVAIAGFIMDINERKQNEIEIKNQNTILQTVIDTIPNVIFYKDNESKYIRANKECRQFYKNMGIDNIIGKTDLEINPDTKLAEIMMADDQCIRETKEVHFTEPAMKFVNGKVEHREVVKAPVINDENEVIGIVGISRDVTERKILEDRLRYLSYTDLLTGVYNRTYFEERILEFQNESCLPIGIIMGDVNGLKLVNDTFGHLEGDHLLVAISNVLKKVCGASGDIFRWGGDEFVILIPNTDEQACEQIVNQIKEECKKEHDCLIELSISLGIAIDNEIGRDIYEALKEAEEKVYRHKLLEQNSMCSSTIFSLQKSLEAKSMETELHTERMLTHSLAIGKAMNLSMAELDELALATKLHDIGKIGISEDILMKPDKLSDEEYNIIKSHPEKGYRIVKASNGLAMVAKGVLNHHERFDGRGYPMGLKGEEIPLIARIISVVDSYDAMTNNRSYRKAMSHDEALEEIKRCSNTQFDPEVVKHFVARFDPYKKIS